MSGGISGVWNGMVVEPLKKENYSTWRVLMKNYLMGKQLWDNIIIEDDDDEVVKKSKKSKDNNDDEVVKKSKDRKALHAIQHSCGREALLQIRQFKEANAAWKHLKATFRDDVRAAAQELWQIRHSIPDRNKIRSIKLQRLVRNGFLNDAKSTINVFPECIFTQSPNGRTVLHAAVSAGRTELVKMLVKMGKQQLVKIQDMKGFTALALAAKLTDRIEMVDLMLDYGGKDLLSRKSNVNGVYEIPVLLASNKGHKIMTRYLFNHTPLSVLTDNDWEYGVVLLSRCIYNDIFDVAAAILQHRSVDGSTISLKHRKSKKYRPIYALANVPSAFPKAAATKMHWWRLLIYNILKVDTIELPNHEKIEIVFHEPSEGPNIMTHTLAGRLFGQFQRFVQTNLLLKIPVIKKIYKMKEDHYLVLEILYYLSTEVSKMSSDEFGRASADDAMLVAAKYGIIEFIESMSKANRELLLARDESNRGIFLHAIMNRQEEVFKLIHGKHDKEIIASSEDVIGNTMLHIAAELGPSTYLDRISNAALQFQRERQWFQNVKKVVPRWCHEAKDSDNKTASELFSENHKELLKSGQQWAKDTSSSFTLVGTLIITIMFAAVFSVPGGNESDDDRKKGLPVFLGKNSFNLYMISDAVSLITSSSSVLMFIGILTSRSAEEDFDRSLPLKLLFGLISLFLSVVSMMCAFCAAINLSLKGYHRIIFAAMGLALVPILVLVPSLLRLATEIFKSTVKFSWFTANKEKKQD